MIAKSDNADDNILVRIRSAAEAEAMAEFKRWREKYEPVENAVYEQRAKRETLKRRRAEERVRAFGDSCEATEGRIVLCDRFRMSLDEVDSIWLTKNALGYWNSPENFLWRAKIIREVATKRIKRISHYVKRPFYYEKEKERRRLLAEERRKVKRRHTLNPCPSKESILDAWIHVKDSQEALLRFGSLMQDLECYADNDLRRTEDGIIIGRNHGIKGWLQVNIPALFLRYKTVMAYKAMAKKLRQLVELDDPVPLDMVLNENKRSVDSGRNKGIRKGKSCDAKAMCGKYSYASEINKAKRIFAEILQLKETGRRNCRENVGESCNRVIVAKLNRKINELLNPDSVTDASVLSHLKDRYLNKITVRRKCYGNCGSEAELRGASGIETGVGSAWRKRKIHGEQGVDGVAAVGRSAW